jgi:hypothetical protein
MDLTDRQIERYSRQIIVSGGVAQERLLASRIAIIGDADDAESVIYYLVGAGVGRIDLNLTGDASTIARIVTHARRLNSDSFVNVHTSADSECDLILILARRSKLTGLVKQLPAGSTSRPFIVARIESPAKIAIMPDAPRCLGCFIENLLAPAVALGDNESFVAAFASIEALKMLISDKPSQQTALIEFDAYSTRLDDASFLHELSSIPCPHQNAGASR